MKAPFFPVSLSFKGQSVTLENSVTTATTAKELYAQARQAYGWDETVELKLLFKGKKLKEDSSSEAVFAFWKPNSSKKVPKIIVMATSSDTVSQIANKKSDPLMRGFSQLAEKAKQQEFDSIWGPLGVQDRNYKFVRFEACTWQSFGHRPNESTPHAFEAIRLLEQLAKDPGIVAIMKERELVVNTLGEMDPIDDRIAAHKEKEGGRVLGYNTNRGLRIDIKLRTDDLKGFRPYPELAATLIHELSHNWVGDHNLVFWTNFAQMRAEYFYHHLVNTGTGLVQGKTTSELAGLNGVITSKESILPVMVHELARDMQQHGLNPIMIKAPIQDRLRELDQEYASKISKEQRLGGGTSGATSSTTSSGDNPAASARERALAAAEQRRRNQQQQEHHQGSPQ
ncbi:unnamed protein product [Cylindrotheca closterium]|uniref:WLM domain-containing protein n=1 Tax=Cylindrotheca closterium TaxID=2856 RepID=A0AAD2CN38_9STRA|nr:unnamed protein product [Cylindrotheca closterium]